MKKMYLKGMLSLFSFVMIIPLCVASERSGAITPPEQIMQRSDNPVIQGVRLKMLNLRSSVEYKQSKKSNFPEVVAECQKMIKKINHVECVLNSFVFKLNDAQAQGDHSRVLKLQESIEQFVAYTFKDVVS